MSKGSKRLEFIKDFAIHKKGGKATFSRDLAAMLISKGVAKLEDSKAVSRKKTKAKAKK